jgi:hypothetical protein
VPIESFRESLRALPVSCDNPERFRRRMFRGFALGAGILLEADEDERVPSVTPAISPAALPMELRICGRGT